MKYTRKQRREIYLKAAEILLGLGVGNSSAYCCGVLAEAIRMDGALKHHELEQSLPEFYLFKPDADLYPWSVWFDDKNDRINFNSRLTTLLLAAEMCNS